MNARPITKVELEWMANRLIYLATPFTLYAEGFEPAATMASNIATRLAKATHGAVFSPIAHAYSLARSSDSDPIKDEVLWRPLNDRMMEECDILVVAHMDGWDTSQGIAQEVMAFTAAGKPIFDLCDINRIDMTRRQIVRPPRDRVDDIPHEMIEQERQQFLEHRNGQGV